MNKNILNIWKYFVLWNKWNKLMLCFNFAVLSLNDLLVFVNFYFINFVLWFDDLFVCLFLWFLFHYCCFVICIVSSSFTGILIFFMFSFYLLSYWNYFWSTIGPLIYYYLIEGSIHIDWHFDCQKQLVDVTDVIGLQ